MSQKAPIVLSASKPDPRTKLITDAVITAYIHEISQRHRRSDPAETLERLRRPV